ncbi:MAG: sugar transferase [Acidimicrobiales bacterium]
MTRSVKLLTPVATVALVMGSEVVHAHFIGDYPVLQEPRFAWVCVLAFVILVTTYAAGVSEAFVSTGARFLRALGAASSAAIIFAVVQLIARTPLVPLFVLGLSTALVAPTATLLATLSERSRVQRNEQEQVVAVVGFDEQERLNTDIRGPLERHAALAAVVTPKMVLPTEDDPEPLITLVASRAATLLVLDREAQGADEIVAQAARLHQRGVRIRTLSLFYDEWLGKLPISELERIALLFDINEIHRPLYARLKRFIDIVLGGAGLVLLLIVTPFVVIADLMGNRGPLFYHQPRVGKDGSTFMILKFRTMKPGSAATEWTAAGDPRLTSAGRLMRRLHVDELPQVWNVLQRDLSIVGPRPEQPHYVAQLTARIPFYDSRHLVHPGITGWAQVKYDYGASEIDAIEKLQYEFYYLRHQSLALDLRIMGRTLRSVASLRGR